MSESSGVLSKAQATARYNRLVRNAKNVHISTQASLPLLNAAQTLLDVYPVTGHGSTPASLPNAEQVKEYLQSLLPPSTKIYTETFFKEPLFAAIFLFDLAKLYGFSDITENFIENLNLSAQDRSDKSIETHIWLAQFLNLSPKDIIAVVEMYKRTRGSPNVLIRSRSNRTSDHLEVIPDPASDTMARPVNTPMDTDRRPQGQLRTDNYTIRPDLSPRTNLQDADDNSVARSVAPAVPLNQSRTPNMAVRHSMGHAGQPPPMDDTRNASYVVNKSEGRLL
ncbi:unnamed protein product [Agarophyton chilense]